jgi:hypothetical protein
VPARRRYSEARADPITLTLDAARLDPSREAGEFYLRDFGLGAGSTVGWQVRVFKRTVSPQPWDWANGAARPGAIWTALRSPR